LLNELSKLIESFDCLKAVGSSAVGGVNLAGTDVIDELIGGGLAAGHITTKRSKSPKHETGAS
jgi:hypothetical protein